MKLFNEMRSFILENEFSIHVYHHKMSVVNYESIGHFDSREVRIYHTNGELIVKGQELVVSKLMQEEILIEGMIQSIEFR